VERIEKFRKDAFPVYSVDCISMGGSKQCVRFPIHSSSMFGSTKLEKIPKSWKAFRGSYLERISGLTICERAIFHGGGKDYHDYQPSSTIASTCGNYIAGCKKVKVVHIIRWIRSSHTDLEWVVLPLFDKFNLKNYPKFKSIVIDDHRYDRIQGDKITMVKMFPELIEFDDDE
jgi:hypothetical protein